MQKNFQCFYGKIIPLQVILIDLVYRKDENYYLKIFLEKKLCSCKKYFDGSENFEQKNLNV